MRLRAVRNDLRGTGFAELMRLVGRYVDVHFTGDRDDVEYGRACEVEVPPCGALLYEEAASTEEFAQVDACSPGAMPPEPPMLESHTCASYSPHAAAPAPAPSRASQDRVAIAAPCAPCAAPPARKSLLAGAPAELGDLLRNLDAGFSQTLLRLIDERGLSDAQVYKRANLSRQLFSKIRKDEAYRPTKQTALALGIALELELDELSTLLERAGYALTHSSKADVIVEYFVTNGCYDVQVINEALYAFDQPLLGSNAA